MPQEPDELNLTVGYLVKKCLQKEDGKIKINYPVIAHLLLSKMTFYLVPEKSNLENCQPREYISVVINRDIFWLLCIEASN